MFNRSILDIINFINSPRYDFINLSHIHLERLTWEKFRTGRALHVVTNNRASAVPAKCISVGMVGSVHLRQPLQVGKDGFAKSKQRLSIQLLKLERRCLEIVVCHTVGSDSVIIPADLHKEEYKEASGDVKSYLGFETKLGDSRCLFFFL